LTTHLHKALALMNVSRYDLAEQELRARLAQDPHDASGHAILALVLSQQDKGQQALEEAEAAVGLAPDESFCHFARATVLRDAKKPAEAARSVEEAIRLDPGDPDYYALLAAIRLDQDRWADALTAAEQGLKQDPENEDCQGCRAVALASLGRTAEAEASSRQALSTAPANAEAHATRGWTLLQAGRHAEALESYREALRLNPNLERARAGIVEALKARNPLYRLVLRYLFWMHSLGKRGRWIFIIGLVVGVQGFSAVARSVPWLEPFRMPVLLAYIGFAVLSWVAVPFSNLLLMLNRFGRLSLKPAERRSALGLGVCFLVMAAGFAAGFATGDFLAECVGFLGLTMSMPVSAALRRETTRQRLILGTCALLLLAAGIAAIALIAQNHPRALTLINTYMIGWVIFSWVGNIFDD